MIPFPTRWQSVHYRSRGTCFTGCYRLLGKEEGSRWKCSICNDKRRKYEKEEYMFRKISVFSFRFLLRKEPVHERSGYLEPTQYRVDSRTWYKVAIVFSSITALSSRTHTGSLYDSGYIPCCLDSFIQCPVSCSRSNSSLVLALLKCQPFIHLFFIVFMTHAWVCNSQHIRC